jgi:hypothetical protein
MDFIGNLLAIIKRWVRKKILEPLDPGPLEPL